MSKTQNITWHGGQVSPEDRAKRLGQKGCCVWLTGLSGSGKSTIARALEARLFQAGRMAYVLDGDNVRHGLNGDLGFSAADREENIRRLAELTSLFVDAGVIAISAFISPYRVGRDLARGKVPPGRFVEVHLQTPLDVCEQRDPKGLYKKARAGEIQDFTGINAPYEIPQHAELTLPTAEKNVDQCVDALMETLDTAGLLTSE